MVTLSLWWCCCCSSSYLSITQHLIGTNLTENIQQMVGSSLCGRPLAAHPTTPPFPYQRSTFLCSPCCFLSHLLAHTPSSITSAKPGHLLPGLKQLAHTRTHKSKNDISYGTWHIQGGHTYGIITCTDSP